MHDIGLDSGLGLLTIRLTKNQTSIIRTLMNSGERTEVSFFFGGSESAKFSIPNSLETRTQNEKYIVKAFP